jgi:hypothetical protein
VIGSETFVRCKHGHLPSTVQNDNIPKVRFSDTLGQEPVVELALA